MKHATNLSLQKQLTNNTWNQRSIKKLLITAQKKVQTNTEITTEKETPEEKKPKIKYSTTINDQSMCMLDNEKSLDIIENIVHRSSQYSFSISDVKYPTDFNGLLKHLGEKIHRGCLCIYCENYQCKDLKSREAVQDHMMDKDIAS